MRSSEQAIEDVRTVSEGGSTDGEGGEVGAQDNDVCLRIGVEGNYYEMWRD